MAILIMQQTITLYFDINNLAPEKATFIHWVSVKSLEHFLSKEMFAFLF